MSLRSFLNQRNTRPRGVSRRRAVIERLEDRALLASQVISATPLTQAVVPGNTVSIEVDYSTLDDSGTPANLQATTLGLRLHYNSSVLTYDNLTNVFSTGLTATQDLPDSSDFDADPATDRYINVAWANLVGNWPGTASTQPLELYSANFTTAGSFTGSTTLNFTRVSAPVGFPDFVSNSPTITEFITPDISISDAADVTEGDTSMFTVSLSENPSGVVTVDYSTANGSTDAADYTAASGQLTFNPGGPLTQQISVATTQDGTVEPDETFFVDLSGAVNGNIIDARGQATILNDDVPEVSVADAGTIDEGNDAVFVVSLDQAPLADVTVTLSTVDGSAAQPGDYTAASGVVLTFSPGGALTQQVTVPTIDDTTAESDEVFTLEIDSVVGGTESATGGSASATIAANDPPVIDIADAGSVTEAGVATFVVSLDQAPAVPLTVDYAATSGSATLTDDFDVTTGTLTFTPTGPLTQQITVQTVADSLVEPDEIFFVDLSNAVNGVVGDGQGQATILDDDVPAISVSDAATVAEGADAVFTVSLDQGPVAPVMVTVGTSDGSAVAPGDYTAASGIVLTFNPGGALTQQVTISTIDDAVLEADEIFYLDLSNPVGGTVADGQGEATVTSDDVPVVSISDAADVNEGQDAVFVVSISELPLAGRNLTVTVNPADVTALNGQDYAVASSVLTFTSAGPLTQQVTVGTIDDSLVEADETFEIRLSNVSNGTIGTGQATGTIISDDVPAVSVADAATVSEGQNAVFTVSLDQAPLADVTIDVTSSDGIAAAPGDYTSLAAQTLTFTPTGPLTQTVAVATVDDSLVEADENFFLDLSSPVGITVADGQGQAIITSDDVPTVSIADSPDTPEGQLAAFAVSIDQAPLPGQDLTVEMTTASGTADDGVDYQSLNITLTFSSLGSLTQVVQITTTDDVFVESDETFSVGLSNVVNGTVGTASGQATILDNDVPAVSIDDVSVTEGSDAVFTVSLDLAPVADVVVTLSTTDDTAVSPDDFTAMTGVVLTFIPGGALTQQVTISTHDDALVEVSERFYLEITDLTGGTAADGQGQATLTSDDGPSISISDAADVSEGGDAVFIVSLDQLPLPGQDVTVDVATVNGTAESGADYDAASQTLTFTSTGPLTQQVTVTTIDDSTVEVTEDFVAELSSPANGTTADGQGSALILDNDLPTVSIDDVTVAEGLDAVFTVSLDQAPVTSLSFTVSTTDGTAISPDDFTAVSDQTVTFDPGGALTQQVRITTIDDTLLETDEDFTVTLGNASNVIVGDGQGLGTITSDDVPSISIDDAVSVNEGQIAVFTVSLDQAPLAGQDLTVDVTTVDGTAVAGSDFDAVSQTLTFTSAGPLTQTVSVQTTDDTTVEADENFTVQLGNPVNGVIADGTGAGRIISDDLPAVSISDAAAFGEGQDAVFTVSLDQAPVSTVTVTYSTADGTASAPGDYTAVLNQTLTFNPGDSLSQTVTVTTIDDGDVESDETLMVELVSATGATIAVAQGTGIISDNDTELQKPVLDAIATFPETSTPTLSWQPVANATGYEIWLTRRFPAESRILNGSSMLSTNSFTPADDLTPAFYKYWVRATSDNGGSGPWSEERTFEVKPTLISPLTPTFETRPTFTWNPIPEAPGYEIFIRTVSGDLRVTDIQGTSFTPTVDLAAGPIRWWIRSSDAIGNRGWSDVGETGNRTRVLAPVGTAGNNQPEIIWQAVQGAGRYILHVQHLDTDTVAIREDRLTATSFTPSTALMAGSYRIWVKAINGATDLFGDGLWSHSVDFTVAAVDHGQLPESAEGSLVVLLPDAADTAPQVSPDASSAAVREPDLIADRPAEQTSAGDETQNPAVASSSVPSSAGGLDTDAAGGEDTEASWFGTLDLWMADPEQVALLTAT
ncbi:MAG: Calx-beta domain-containing protein [Fuerstiella sp.]